MQLVILDRDVVIDFDSGARTSSEHEWQAIPGSLEALARLSGAGYRLVVACNEPGLRRKNFNIETLVSVHHRMQLDLLDAGGGLDAVFFCSCLPKDDCDCTMPNPGLLHEIAERLRTPIADVPIIGSNLATIEAGRAAGARPIFIGDAAGAELESDLESYEDLAAAVDSLLTESASA